MLKDSRRCQGAVSWYSYSSLDVNNYRHYLVQKWNPMWDLPPQYSPRPFQKIGFVHSFSSDNTGQSWKCWYHGCNLYASKWPWGVEASCRSNRRTMLMPMPHHLSQVIYLICSWHWAGGLFPSLLINSKYLAIHLHSTAFFNYGHKLFFSHPRSQLSMLFARFFDFFHFLHQPFVIFLFFLGGGSFQLDSHFCYNFFFCWQSIKIWSSWMLWRYNHQVHDQVWS